MQMTNPPRRRLAEWHVSRPINDTDCAGFGPRGHKEMLEVIPGLNLKNQLGTVSWTDANWNS